MKMGEGDGKATQKRGQCLNNNRSINTTINTRRSNISLIFAMYNLTVLTC